WKPPAAPSERSLSLSLPGPREGQATLKPPPQHLWRQPRTPIRIQQRGYSDSAERAEPERPLHRPIERADAVDTSDRPGLRTSRMSWPSSFHGTGSGGAGGGSCRRLLLPEGGSQHSPSRSSPSLQKTTSLALHSCQPSPCAPRRRAALMRSGTDYSRSPAVSPPSVRVSETHAEDLIVTPFAQVLASLRSVRSNFSLLTNVPIPSNKRSPLGGPPPVCKAHCQVEGVCLKAVVSLCLSVLLGIRIYDCVSGLPVLQFKRMLNRELTHLSEMSRSGNQVSEYISTTFLDKQNEVEILSPTMKEREKQHAPRQQRPPQHPPPPVPQFQPMSQITGVKKLMHSSGLNSASIPRFGVKTDQEELLAHVGGAWRGLAGEQEPGFPGVQRNIGIWDTCFIRREDRKERSKHIESKTVFLSSGAQAHQLLGGHNVLPTDSVSSKSSKVLGKGLGGQVTFSGARMLLTSILHPLQELENLNKWGLNIFRVSDYAGIKYVGREKSMIYNKTNCPSMYILRCFQFLFIFSFFFFLLVQELWWIWRSKIAGSSGTNVFFHFCRSHSVVVPSAPGGNVLMLFLLPQVGFIDYIVHPLWETWADLVHPDAQEILDTLEDNRDWYYSAIRQSPSPPPEEEPGGPGHPPPPDKFQFELTTTAQITATAQDASTVQELSLAQKVPITAKDTSVIAPAASPAEKLLEVKGQDPSTEVEIEEDQSTSQDTSVALDAVSCSSPPVLFPESPPLSALRTPPPEEEAPGLLGLPSTAAEVGAQREHQAAKRSCSVCTGTSSQDPATLPAPSEWGAGGGPT
uniref:3',5'-cyclic-AMP phosphodiesterase n=1 Tax=Loxodonta africana TaxID=9785 RepID=G3TVY9_LOXAF